MYTNHSRQTNQKYQAYATAAMTVAKTKQVVMLYDGMIRYVQQSIDAIKRGDFETRYHLLTKTAEILSGLQTSLDFDNGGDIAKLLYDYYASLDARIFSVHRSNDIHTLESITRELRMMRDVWHGIDQDQGREKKVQMHEPVPAMAMSGERSLAGIGVSA